MDRPIFRPLPKVATLLCVGCVNMIFPATLGKMRCLVGTSCVINLRGGKKSIPRRLIHAEYAKGESEKRELQKTLSEVATTAGGVWKVQK